MCWQAQQLDDCLYAGSTCGTAGPTPGSDAPIAQIQEAKEGRMKLIDNILYLTFEELTACGISEFTLRGARRDKSSGWNFIDDPDDQRKVLIQYRVLKPQYKAQVDARFTPDAPTYFRNHIIEQLLPAPHQALKFYREFRLDNGTGLPDVKIKLYTEAARVCLLIADFSNKGGKAKLKKLGFDKTSFYTAIAAHIQTRELPLPCAYSKLMLRVRQVIEQGFAALVSRKFANDNSQKLTPEQQQWIIARYAQVTKPDAVVVALELAEKSTQMGWPVVGESCIRKFLSKPANKQLWFYGRHGEKVWRNHFEHHAKLSAPMYRDSLWCSDGTKLNFFYRDDEGKVSAAQQCYLVVDVFSEAIIGWSIDTREDHATQYVAYKMAIGHAQHKPFQILYDNQSGHKSHASQDFYDRLSRAHFPAQPYNAQAKPVESIIGRFQKQVMRKLWFFTGQNITATSLDSRIDGEYVKARKEELPTLPEVKRLFKMLVEEWNGSKHPKMDQSRIAAYTASTNPQAQPVEYLDMVELFWMFTKETTYRRGGITLFLRGQKYEYEVIGEDGQPNVSWINAHVQDTFIIGYDPDDITHIRLYKDYPDGRRFITAAYPKKEYSRAVQDHQPGTAADIRRMLEVRSVQKKTVKKLLQEAAEQSGVPSEAEAAYQILHGDKDNMISAENSVLIHQMGLYSDGYNPDELPSVGRFAKD